MAEQLATPRITAPYLSSFASKIVMLWGKVIQLRGEEAIIDSDGTVQLILNRESHLTNGNAVQIIGKVNPDLTVKVLSSRDLGQEVDMNLYFQVVDVTHKHRSIFSSDN